MLNKVPAGGVTLIVQDFAFYGPARAARPSMEPSFDTFVLTVPENGAVAQGCLFMCNTMLRENWQQRHHWRRSSPDATTEERRLRASQVVLRTEPWRALLNLNALIPWPPNASRRQGKGQGRIQSQPGFVPVAERLKLKSFFLAGFTRFLAMQSPRPRTFGALCDALWELETGLVDCPEWLTASRPLHKTNTAVPLAQW